MSVFLCVIDELPFATNMFVLTIYKFKITSMVLFIVSMTRMSINKSFKVIQNPLFDNNGQFFPFKPFSHSKLPI